jgi:hypothetical protein
MKIFIAHIKGVHVGADILIQASNQWAALNKLRKMLKGHALGLLNPEVDEKVLMQVTEDIYVIDDGDY